MGLFKRKKKPVELPLVLTQQEDPVNYNSVLDYLTGLSNADYSKIIKVSSIYRNANKEAARVIGVIDQPTVSLLTSKPTDTEIDKALDDVLSGDYIDDTPDAPKATKQQSTPPTHIDIEEKI